MKRLFLIIFLSACGWQAEAQISGGPGMFPMADYNLQGIVCNNRYCSYHKYGLRWALSTMGESVIWQHKETKFIKIGFITLNAHKAEKNLLARLISTLKSEANSLATARGYYFKYCDAVTHACTYLGNKKYYTVHELERLFIPVMETRQAFPIDVAGKLIERRNKIVLTFAGMLASLYVATKMTFTGTVSGTLKTVWESLSAIFTGKAKKLTKAAEGMRKMIESAPPNATRLNRLLPKIAGTVGFIYFAYHNVKSWELFSPEAYIANYYAKNVKMPLLMSIPDMFVADRKEKLSIETIREAFDLTLKGELGKFIADYQTKQELNK